VAALTKADLSEHLNDVVGLNKREAKEMVEILFDELSDSLISGDPVRLSDSVTSNSETKGSVPVVTQRLVKRFL